MVSLRTTILATRNMLFGPSSDVVRYADVKYRVVNIRHDVGAIDFIHDHSMPGTN